MDAIVSHNRRAPIESPVKRNTCPGVDKKKKNRNNNNDYDNNNETVRVRLYPYTSPSPPPPPADAVVFVPENISTRRPPREYGKRSRTYVRPHGRRAFGYVLHSCVPCTHAAEQPKLLFDSDGEMEKVYPL